MARPCCAAQQAFEAGNRHLDDAPVQALRQNNVLWLRRAQLMDAVHERFGAKQHCSWRIHLCQERLCIHMPVEHGLQGGAWLASQFLGMRWMHCMPHEIQLPVACCSKVAVT